MNNVLKEVLSKVYAESESGEISIHKTNFDILLKEVNELDKTLTELDLRYCQLLSHSCLLEKIQTGLIHDRDNAYNEITKLKQEIKELRHAIVDDDSITDHKEILDFAEDLNDAYNKISKMEVD